MDRALFLVCADRKIRLVSMCAVSEVSVKFLLIILRIRGLYFRWNQLLIDASFTALLIWVQHYRYNVI